jgi:hypothetical protein
LPFNFSLQAINLFESKTELFISFLSILLLLFVEFLQEQFQIQAWLPRQPLPVRLFAYYILVMVITIFGVFVTTQQFVYVQF